MGISSISTLQSIPAYTPDAGRVATGTSNWENQGEIARSVSRSVAPAATEIPTAEVPRRKREVRAYEIINVPGTLEEIRQSPEVCAKLRQAAVAAKAANVREAEVKIYSPMVKKLGRSRGDAVSAFLVAEGVPQHRINVVLKGPGIFNENWSLATARGVRIELDVKESAPA